jgi:hypothetical protein
LLSEALGACARLRVAARLFEVRNTNELDRAFATFATERPDAVLTLLDPVFTMNTARIVSPRSADRDRWWRPAVSRASDPADREGARHHCPADAAGACGRGDSVAVRLVLIAIAHLSVT